MMRRARVVAVHPEDHSVDVVMVSDGSRYAGVQVLSPTAASDAGVFDMPAPSELSDKWSLSSQRQREVTAAVMWMDGFPVVVGFFFPRVNSMLFADIERRIMRHASDVYTSIDGNGNMEVSHPNGTYLRIGTSPDHEDLTGKDFDGNWAISKNTGAATHLQVVVKAGDAQKAKLHIDPSGNITLEHTGNLVVDTTGTVSVTAGGAATVDAPSVTLDTPQTTCTGALTVQGLLTYQAGLSGSGGAGAALTGNLNVTGNIASTGTVQNNGKNIGSTHTHSGVQTGGGNTGAPV